MKNFAERAGCVIVVLSTFSRFLGLGNVQKYLRRFKYFELNSFLPILDICLR
ncbi:MAG: DUF645 family protein [Legionella sp.]|nr:DUF645 family protein [Legionella sp.]